MRERIEYDKLEQYLKWIFGVLGGLSLVILSIVIVVYSPNKPKESDREAVIRLRADREVYEAEQERQKRQLDNDVLRERIRRGEFNQ